MDDWSPEQRAVFIVVILCVGAVGATISYLHEKRHPYFKPNSSGAAQPSRGPFQLVGPIIWWCIKAILVVGAFLLALFVLIKLIKFFWYI